MILSKEDLKFYLDADKFALRCFKKRVGLSFFPTWRYQIYLRKYEYYHNNNSGIINNILRKYYFMLYKTLGVILGFTIYPNCIGPGLRINHYGLLIINERTKIGHFLDINQGVNIGVGSDGKVPTIGNNVYIAPGAKLFGNIHIGNDVAIGANSVVNKDVENGVTVAGIPAHIINTNGTKTGLYKEETKKNVEMFLELYPQYIKYFN